jgi:starch phosphorylase
VVVLTDGAVALPPEIAALRDLALDLRWTWSHGADALFRSADAAAWSATQNAWYVLQNLSRARADALARDPGFVSALREIEGERARYVVARAEDGPAKLAGELVAYFCMEFGLGEAIPFYAGGLGILAGDVLKTASDLAVPMVGLGLLFQEGYFRQWIDREGRQQEAYPYADPSVLPIEPVAASDGSRLRIPLELPGRTVWVRAFRVRVGRVDLYLLDTNDLLNDPTDRSITSKLYPANAETRLLQELVLGIGGFRLLDALGLPVTVAHLNEGHAAFAAIERARLTMKRRGLSFEEALWATRAGNVFTTHTPVAAGFDRFDAELLERHALAGTWFAELGISERRLLALGRSVRNDPDEPFNMAYLALRCCAHASAVSALHAEVSRELFAEVFPRVPEREVPIVHVTNGVHVPSWDSAEADELWERACGKDRWRRPIDAQALHAQIDCVDDATLWRLRNAQRRALLSWARDRLATHLARRGLSPPGPILDDGALTIGFARRFAEYKRPTLLLRDTDRLTRLLCDPDRPVQLVIAGKAHPADDAGKELVAAWIDFVRRPEVRRRVVFLEDYDIAVACRLVSGVDVWLNTPRRPWEACGTSGMKVLANGGLNLSSLDGWWAEAYEPDVGFRIGRDGPSDDAADAAELYALLEREVVPEFYDRDGSGLPSRWLSRVRASMSRLAPRFSAGRMEDEYVDRLYVPAAAARRRREDDVVARSLASFQRRVTAAWPSCRIGGVEVVEARGELHFRATAVLSTLLPEDVRVELYADAVDGGEPVRQPMQPSGTASSGRWTFEAVVPAGRPASAYTPRVVPRHPDALLPAELPLVLWAR